jgi:ABC-type polysaccharide/polyol phosphate export permease
LTSLPASENQSARHWLELVVLLVRRDLKVRYRGSFAGYLWTMLNPLVLMAVLTLVFTKVGNQTSAFYPLYVLSGILCWNTFAQSLLTGAHSIINNAGLLKKVHIPQWVFPSVSVLSALTNMLFAFPPFIAVALILGFHFKASLFALPLILFLFFVFLVGLVLVVGTLNVFFRDVGHMLESGMLILFYSAPIAYPIDMVPQKWQFILHLHPLFYFLKAFRSALIDGPITLEDWGLIVITSMTSLTVGLLAHYRLRDRLFYYL